MARGLDVPNYGIVAAAGFLSGWMLLFAVGAAIPIILHLLNRRRQVPTRWAAMQLLLKVVQQQSRRLRIEQLILLAIRVAIPILLAIALARPYLNQSPEAATDVLQPTRQYWIIAIDTSYSMGYRTADQSLLAQAKAQASELVAQAATGDAFALVALDSPARGIISSPTFDSSGVLMAIRQLEMRYQGLNLTSGLDLIEDLAERADGDSIPDNVNIVIYSDMGRDGWDVDAAITDRLGTLSQTRSVRVIPLSVEQPSNDAIVQVMMQPGRAIRGQTSQMEVVVERFGAATNADVSLSIELDGRTIVSKQVAIEPRSKGVIPIEITWETAGPVVLTAKLSSDALEADDSRSLCLEVYDSTRVLIVEQETDAALPIELALRSAASGQSSLEIKVVSSVATAAISLDGWDLVILQDVATVSRPFAGALFSFVSQGGAVIVAHGSRSLAESWNQAWPADSSLLSYRLDRPSELARVDLDPLDYRSSIVEPFRGFTDSGLLTTPIFRYWKIQPLAADLGDVALATSGGEPLIIESTVGQGRVVSLMTAPTGGFDPTGQDAWNAMTTWPSFVPLMQRMFESVLAGRKTNNLSVSQSLQGFARLAPDTGQVTVLRPDGTTDAVTLGPTGPAGDRPWVYDQTTLPGVYQVELPGLQFDSFAVNMNPIESSMEVVPLERLPRLTSAADRPAPAASQAVLPEPADSLGIWFVAVVGGLLVLETLLAWWFGRRIG